MAMFNSYVKLPEGSRGYIVYIYIYTYAIIINYPILADANNSFIFIIGGFVRE